MMMTLSTTVGADGRLGGGHNDTTKKKKKQEEDRAGPQQREGVEEYGKSGLLLKDSEHWVTNSYTSPLLRGEAIDPVETEEDHETEYQQPPVGHLTGGHTPFLQEADPPRPFLQDDVASSIAGPERPQDTKHASGSHERELLSDDDNTGHHYQDDLAATPPSPSEINLDLLEDEQEDGSHKITISTPGDTGNDSESEGSLAGKPREKDKTADGGSDGKQGNDIETSIVGGRRANPTRYPYFVAMYRQQTSTSSWRFHCGGTLIAPDFVLSAAHCWANSPRPYAMGFVVNHTQDILRFGFTGYDQERSWSELWWHPSYSVTTLANDYMLIQLDRPVTSIEPVRLNNLGSVPAINAAVTVFGFGFQSKVGGVPGSNPDYLQEVELNTVSRSACDVYGNPIIDSIMLCAAGNRGEGGCNGDSGGPLVVRGSSRFSDRQVGVVSFGHGSTCGLGTTFPDVYARVSGRFGWIHSIVCPRSSNPPSYLCPNSNPPRTPTQVSTPSPTRFPTPFPTRFPTPFPTTPSAPTLPNIVDRGISGCSPTSTCSVCQGDCDSDSDCRGTLECFHRNGLQPIPGCSGLGTSGLDYCYIPSDSDGILSSCSPTSPCSQCFGDCDSDSDCRGTLRCFQRSGLQPIPSCNGLGRSGWDYCYDAGAPIPFPTTPSAPFPTRFPTPFPTRFPTPFPTTPPAPTLPTFDWGISGCTPTLTCSLCEGDCDYDSDCRGTLKCFHRNGLQPIPGCRGLGTYAWDYCYDAGALTLFSTREEPEPRPLEGDDENMREESAAMGAAVSVPPLKYTFCSVISQCHKCQGHCAWDSDCKGDLKCFFHSERASVPGCGGSGRRGMNYCFDPKDNGGMK